MGHAFYIYTAYGLTTLIVAALVAWTWLDGRARQRELAALDAAGIRRRSARSPGETKA
ncbi:heme exporter protein CcmD [Rhizobiaceae bacterium n13]|uniref:Heme exporter protein D n=1 Tax=Ferirhizobium litorale TaxID=2927786 RepID=A0AAE3U4R7_9HYPH|nr:heme exporter protein CcmD [Fererhizobium litorale]MDI7862415.1 heme exporter protein CcmD [Fererhizobium litorale]MDI7923698.1 heme exporter protein CcmD [Fererhizobium litorale]